MRQRAKPCRSSPQRKARLREAASGAAGARPAGQAVVEGGQQCGRADPQQHQPAFSGQAQLAVWAACTGWQAVHCAQASACWRPQAQPSAGPSWHTDLKAGKTVRQPASRHAHNTTHVLPKGSTVLTWASVTLPAGMSVRMPPAFSMQTMGRPGLAASTLEATGCTEQWAGLACCQANPSPPGGLCTLTAAPGSFTVWQSSRECQMWAT